MTPLRELQLLEQDRRGDPEAISELLQAYQRRVYSVCYRMLRDPEEAADLTQDSLVKVLEGLDSYDGRSRLSTWIIRVTMNCCLSHLRKEKVRRTVSLDGANPAGDSEEEPGRAGGLSPASMREPSAEQNVEQSETRQLVHRALADLDPDVRGLLVLRDMQGLDYEQLAEVLEVPIGTVKSRLFRARAALRQALEKMGV